MILVVIEVALVTFTCLVIVPSAVVSLATLMFDGGRVELPVARVLPKTKTGRRFQRPAYQQLS